MSAIQLLIPSKMLGASDDVQFTASSKTIIDSFTATNVSGVAVSITCYLVVKGDSSKNDNKIIDSKIIDAHETYVCRELIGSVLDIGDKLNMYAGAASSISIRANGRIGI